MYGQHHLCRRNRCSQQTVFGTAPVHEQHLVLVVPGMALVVLVEVLVLALFLVVWAILVEVRVVLVVIEDHEQCCSGRP